MIAVIGFFLLVQCKFFLFDFPNDLIDGHLLRYNYIEFTHTYTHDCFFLLNESIDRLID